MNTKFLAAMIVAATTLTANSALAEEACIKALGGFVICGEVVK